MPDSTADTLAHIDQVRRRINEVRFQLGVRATTHDASKLEEPEKSGFDVLTVQLATLEYGSDAYKQALVDAGPTIQHHYAQNRHHPEFHADGIADMTLIDVIEMICDWKAASARTKHGSIAASLAHNKERFGISDQLAAILENTARELGW